MPATAAQSPWITWSNVFRNLPRIELTPGDWDPAAPFPRGPRPQLAMAVKAKVVSDYQLAGVPSHLYVFDHLVPWSLGGLSTAKNIWPMPVCGLWPAALKDHLEDYCIRAVTHKMMGIQSVRQSFCTDWISFYASLSPQLEVAP